MTELLPCPFCGGKADINLQGSMPYVECFDCAIAYSIQASDHFTDDERFNDPAFKWRDAPYYDYGTTGTQRAKEVLTGLWNTRVDPWQPIESAPRGGTPVLLLYDNYLPIWGEFDGKCWRTTDFLGRNSPVPTLYFSHWMPLPQPPRIER